MEPDVLEDIRMLRHILEKVGMRELSDMLVENIKNNGEAPDQLIRSCWQMSQGKDANPSTPGADIGYFNYVLYGMLKSYGETQSEPTQEASGFTQCAQNIKQIGAFSMIFTTLLCTTLKKIKALVSNRDARHFHLAVRGFSSILSQLLNGGYGLEFYDDLETEDIKRIVFLLRTLLSLFLDEHMDLLYKQGQLPVHTLFVWARCIVHVVNVINGPASRYVDGFEQELVADFIRVVRLGPGKRTQLLQRTMRNMESVSPGIEMKSPLVNTSINIITVMAVLISEFSYNNQVVKDVSLDNRHWDITKTPARFTTAMAHTSGCPIVLFSQKASIYMLERMLKPVLPSIGTCHATTHSIAICHAYIYMNFGYCDFNYKGNFISRLLGDSGDGEYGSNCLLQFIDRLETCRLMPHSEPEGASTSPLGAMRLMQEWLVQLVHDQNRGTLRNFTPLRGETVERSKHGDAKGDANHEEDGPRQLLVIARTLLVYHLHYFKTRILAMGVHSHDMDYYGSFFKMTAITLHKFRYRIAEEVADILVSILHISIRVVNKTKDRERLLRVLPQTMFGVSSARFTGNTDDWTTDSAGQRSWRRDSFRRGSSRSSERLHSGSINASAMPVEARDNILRFTPYAYTNALNLANQCIKWSCGPYDMLKVMYKQMKESGVALTSLLIFARKELQLLFRKYVQYSKIRKSKLDFVRSCTVNATNNPSASVGTPSNGHQRSNSVHYGFAKCLTVSSDDEKTVVTVCIAAEMAIICLRKENNVDNKEIAISFIFLNSLVLLILDALKRLKSGGSSTKQRDLKRTVTLLLETYFNVQSLGIRQRMRTAVRASLSSLVAICDAAVELLVYRLIKTEVKMPSTAEDLLEDKANLPVPLKWKLIMSCMRCITASPIKDVTHIVSTLCLLLSHNSEVYRMAIKEEMCQEWGASQQELPSQVHSTSRMLAAIENESQPKNTKRALENAMATEKILVHTLKRYLSNVAYNLRRLQSSDRANSALDSGYVNDIFSVISLFLERTSFADPAYNTSNLVPYILNLSQLLEQMKCKKSKELISYCVEAHRLNRRKNAVMYTVPFLSDPKRYLIIKHYQTASTDTPEVSIPMKEQRTAQKSSKRHKKDPEARQQKQGAVYLDKAPYIKKVLLSALRAPKFCFFCRRQFVGTIGCGEYHVTCKYCLHPLPLICEGAVDLNNRSSVLYVATMAYVGMQTVTDGNMINIAASASDAFSGESIHWDSLMATMLTDCNHFPNPIWSPQLLIECSRDLSNTLAAYMKCVNHVAPDALEIMSHLRYFGDSCLIWLLDKNRVHRKLKTMSMDNYYIQFFKDRFEDQLALMSDSGADPEYMELHYFYDSLMMSLCSATNNPRWETDCLDINRGNAALLVNMSITTLSQHVKVLLRGMIEGEAPWWPNKCMGQYLMPLCTPNIAEKHSTIVPTGFSRGLVELSQIANVFAIPITKLLLSGLGLPAVRTAICARAELACHQHSIKMLLEVILSPEVCEKLENIHEKMMLAVLCCDSKMNFTIENCDYTLFQIMQRKNGGLTIQQTTEQLRKLEKYKFYAMVRLLWYVTNPHVALRMENTRGNRTLLEVQAEYVQKPFKWFLEMMRKYRRQHKSSARTQKQTLPTDIACVDQLFPPQELRTMKAPSGLSTLSSMQATTDNLDEAKPYEEGYEPQSPRGHLDTFSDIDVMVEYLQENFVRILEYFVAVWLKRGPQSLNFAMKNKRVFYPEIYCYKGKQRTSRTHIVRTYNCIAILMWIYSGDIDVFCDRMIEVLTMCPITSYNSWILMNCWSTMTMKMSSTLLPWYAPGIAYHVTRLGRCKPADVNSQSSNADKEPEKDNGLSSSSIISDIKSALKSGSHSEGFFPFIDCIVDCVSRPSNISLIHIKIGLLATLVHSDDQIKVPYVTREAAALTANQLLELNPFIFNIPQAKEAARKLAISSLLTIAAYSDDFAKDPTTLAMACCSILGYIPCDLSIFKLPTEQRTVVDLQCSVDGPRDLAKLVLRGYLIPNMHMQVALYCIQEILKLLKLYKGGVRSPHELAEMGERWNRTFEPVIRRAIAPYRATSFLRNKAIEDVIETRLEVNTVLDIKSFVWWLLKMLPPSCPMLTLFRACDLAMVKIPSVLSFLLPYIVDSCVQFLDENQCITIGKRMASLLCNILKKDSHTFGINWQPPYEVLSKSGKSFESKDHYTSCQAIFNLLDNIKIMIDRYRKALDNSAGSTAENSAQKQEPSKEEGQTENKNNEESASKENDKAQCDVTPTEKQEPVGSAEKEANLELLRTRINRLQSILFAVPELLVAHAAISCGSYARGVMIIEKKIAYGACAYNFGDPSSALSNRALRENVHDNGGLRPQAIISLLCRGYCGLGEFDSVVCISNIVLNDDSLRSVEEPASDVSNSNEASLTISISDQSKACNMAKFLDSTACTVSKRQREVCRAFSYECRGKYRLACDVYNKLLKTSQDSRLWASWYRIIQMTGPSVFIRLPKPPEIQKSFDSLIAESITACWKLTLWEELDELLAKKRTKENEVLELHTEELNNFDFVLVDKTVPVGGSADMQWTQCTANGQDETNVFWESLLMRDPIDVWFMEQTADAMSGLHKSQHDSIERTVQDGFKHLIRPLGLAIRESTLVAVKYLEKIAIFNAIRLSNRFNSGKYDMDERRFARELIAITNSSKCPSTRNTVDVLGAAKVALELGGKIDAAAEILVSLNRICRKNSIDIHIPGSLSLDDEVLSSRNDVLLENALTLQQKGNVDDAISSLNILARHDFDGFYNLVKLYLESNLLIPKRAVSYMREILQVTPYSFKANLLHAEYLDRLLEHRLKNAQNIRLVLDDSSIISRRTVHKTSVQSTHKIAGVDGIPGIYTFVQLVSAAVNAYLQALSFVGGSRQGSSTSSREHHLHVTGSSIDLDLKPNSGATSGSRSFEHDDPVITTSSQREPAGNNTLSYISTEGTQDMGGTMDIVDILTKVVTIVCFYCTPNTTQFSSSVTFENEACQIFSHAIMERFFEYNDLMPQFYWYAVISQLMSRCNHKVLGACLFQTLVARLVARYPKQALWSTLYFAHSVNPRMRQIHVNLERKARELCPSTALIIEYYHSIFKEMSKVAMDTTVSITDKSAMRFQGIWRVLNSQGCKELVIIPTMQNLSFEHIINYDLKEAESRMCGMDENMQVLRSKQKPKKVGLMSTAGKVVHFLVKNEVKGDLRKDKRMMEVTQYLAMLLKKHYNGLPLQCYSVISLTEVAGIIEWVPNMATMRALVMDELRRVVDGVDRDSKSLVNRYATCVTSKKFGDSLKLFRSLCEKRPPVLHRSYYNIFKRDPAAWFCARREYIHTCAVWSILGYIVGLGDRHAENILLNITTGQMMHVDFDCLFGKGLQLAIPELVPFRMTQNVVCNLGVCGTATDGPFYSQALKFLQMLHQTRQKITAIIMSFVFDPLIEWNRGEGIPNADTDSQKVVQCIEDKLRGALNVVIPSVEINSRLLSSGQPEDIADLHAFKAFETVAEIMEPRQQLQQLIQVSTSHAHLSKMFVGWAPWM